jgi:hypothetical protein
MNPFQGLGQRTPIRIGEPTANGEILLRKKHAGPVLDADSEDAPRPKLTRVIQLFALRDQVLSRQAAYVIDFYPKK